MSAPVRVLLVNGTSADADLLTDALRRGGYEPAAERVGTREAMNAALLGGPWDIVLADSAPELDVSAVLSLLKERDLDVPVLLVSDRIGEDSAARAIRAGARSCIRKESLRRLAPTVDRELHEARLRHERRQAQKALRESDARFRILAETLSDAILTVREGGQILFANPAAEKIFGYPVAAMIGEPLTMLIPDSLRHLQPDEGGPDALREAVRLAGRHQSGRAIPLELSFGTGSREGKRLWTLTARDVTERKRAENALRESEERFRVAAQSSSDLIYEWDIAGGSVLWFGDIDKTLGYGPGEFPRTLEAWESRLHPEDHGRVMAAVERHLSIGERFFQEYRIVRKDGSVLTWTDSGMALRDSSGRLVKWVGAVTDVTERRHAQEALHASEARYRMLFERNLAGVFRTTLDGRILDCNDSFARIFGYASREEVLKRPASDFYLSVEERNAFLARIRAQQHVTNYELCLRRKDGTLVWILENGSLIPGPDGELSLMEGTVIDITERKRAEEQVKRLAFYDLLTGLPNRLLFSDRVTVALAQARRNQQQLAILFLDLDRFKLINDSLGHSVGDQLLQTVAERLQGCVREGDTVARLGGDEFTLLVPGISSEEDAVKIAQKVLESIRLPFSVDRRELFITTSIGVSLYPTDGKDAEDLIRNADTAMYRAKDQGRDNCQLYTPAMSARALERLALEGQLRQALANGELVLHYQPMVDLRSGQICGAEALLRWQHPELGLVPPGEFIALAEISGLIVPMGLWVLRSACAQMRAWHRKGYPQLSVAVNLSTRQFQQADLAAQVSEVLRETGLDSGSLDLEITETNAMQNVELSISTLSELKKLGVRISMDDFGTGYSSLSYLKRFPIDRIKIDESFVRDINADPDDAAIATAVIAMARSLNLIVIAEGVETEEQLAFLCQHQCDLMQGYLFSAPVTASQFESLLGKRTPLPSRFKRSRFGKTSPR